MTDDISKLEAERAATREQRDAYRREHGWRARRRAAAGVGRGCDGR